MKVSQNFGIEGYFNLVVRDANTLEVKRETGFFKNRITNYGLDRLAADGVLYGAAVGSGTTPPADTDVALANQVARTSTVLSNNVVIGPAEPPYYSGKVITYRFPQGAAAGNLSEVGINGNYLSPYQLWSRSLILDTSGNPTTLTVLPNEILDVTYECRIYPMDSDTTGGPVSLLGIDYNWTMRAIAARGDWSSVFESGFSGGATWEGYSGDLVAATGFVPGGSYVGVSGASTLSAYVGGSFKITQFATWSVSQGNGSGAAGIKSVKMFTGVGESAKFQMGFDKIYPKNTSNTLTLGVEISWGRRAI